MELRKSERHSKILGDFGEILTMYWLSKRNFEPVHVDYTGIDIIAYDNKLKNRLGISVKSRTRTEGKEQDSISVDSTQIPKIYYACKCYDCLPYFACLIDKDAENSMEIYLIPLADALKINEYKEGDTKLYIRFKEEQVEKYKKLKNSIVIKFNYEEIKN